MIKALLFGALASGLAVMIRPEVASAGELPSGFVYLRSVDASIVQDMRYATNNNFTGRPVDGYAAGECVLAASVAKALASAQRDLLKQGYSLVTYDCYRPARAVRAFVAWARGNKSTNPAYHPTITAEALFAAGYIAARSGHSSGGAVDVGLLRQDRGALVPVEMGSSFDFFGTLSHVGAKGIGEEATANRQRLAKSMQRAGFQPYAREWWHFQARNQPFKGRIFDFEISPP